MIQNRHNVADVKDICHIISNCLIHNFTECGAIWVCNGDHRQNLDLKNSNVKRA